jgi:hypothetical protein
MMHFAESSRRQLPRLAIVSLVVTVLAWSLPSHAFDLGGDDDKQAKKCPSGKARNEQKKCESLKSGDLSDDDLAQAGRHLRARATTKTQ